MLACFSLTNYCLCKHILDTECLKYVGIGLLLRFIGAFRFQRSRSVSSKAQASPGPPFRLS